MDKELELLNRRVAADLLVVLIDKGLLKPSGASKNETAVVADTVKAYEALLTGIDSVKRE